MMEQISILHMADNYQLMPGDCVDEWIRPDAKPEELVDAALTEMVYEKVESKPRSADENVQMSML